MSLRAAADAFRIKYSLPASEPSVAVLARAGVGRDGQIVIDFDLLRLGDATHLAAVQAMLGLGVSNLIAKVTVANQAARYALTTAQVQNGDYVFQTDTGILYEVTDQTALNGAGGYTALATVTAAQISDATANGRSFITAENYAAMRALLDLEAGTDFLSPAAIAAAYQAISANLTDLAGTTLEAYGLTLLGLADAAAARTLFGTVIGTDVGYANIPQNSQSAAYTTVLADAGKHILHPTADNNARTFTIDSNANVASPIGTAITFVNEINTVTIAITDDTLTLAGAGTTGSRTLAANGIATALKTGAASWLISGTGLT